MANKRSWSWRRHAGPGFSLQSSKCGLLLKCHLAHVVERHFKTVHAVHSPKALVKLEHLEVPVKDKDHVVLGTVLNVQTFSIMSNRPFILYLQRLYSNASHCQELT